MVMPVARKVWLPIRVSIPCRRRHWTIPKAGARSRIPQLDRTPTVRERARIRGPSREDTTMAVVNVIELLAESEEGWEDAVRQAVAEATKTLRGITSVYVEEFQATVENDKVKNFRVNVKVSFVLEEDRKK